MTEKELSLVTGGAVNIASATYLNSIARGIDALYSIGRSFGSSIRMLISGRKC